MQKHCGLDKLLDKLNGKTYQQISKDFPDLVKPVEEFVTSRGLISENTAVVQGVKAEKV